MRRHKFNAKSCSMDGYKFASLAEMKRYGELKMLVRAGEIDTLTPQPRFDIIVNGVSVGFYKADFSYVDVGKSARVIEDVKGVRTPVYKLKKCLVEALYGVTIVEIGA